MTDILKLLVTIFLAVELLQVMRKKSLSKNLRKAKHRQRSIPPSPQVQTPTPVIHAPQSCKQHVPVPSKWKCVGASAVGSNHAGHLPCQDSNQYAWLDTGELVVAVSDGAGSAKRSDRGSQLACAAAVRSLKQAVTNSAAVTDASLQIACKEAFQAALDAIQAEAISQETTIAEYAATLLVLVCTNDFVMTGMVGDGAVVILGADGCLEYVLSPQRGEYANEAYFITSYDAPTKLQIKVLPTQVQAMAMMTDALLKISGNYKKQRPHPGFFSAMFQFICSVTDEKEGCAELMEFLSSDRVNQNTDDDKTLLLVANSQLTEVIVQDESTRSERSNIHPAERNSESGRGESIHSTRQAEVVSQDLPHTEQRARAQAVGDDGTDAPTTLSPSCGMAREGIVRETDDGFAAGVCGLPDATSGQNSNALPNVPSGDPAETFSSDQATPVVPNCF